MFISVSSSGFQYRLSVSDTFQLMFQDSRLCSKVLVRTGPLGVKPRRAFESFLPAPKGRDFEA
jgi:hypothetical protein